LENIEIIFTNISNEYIDLIIFEELNLTDDKVISSHFFDTIEQKDIELSDVSSLKEYYSTPNTGNIFVQELFIGDEISNVMLVLSFDGKEGDVVLNFEEKECITSSDKLKLKIEKVFVKLIEIFNRYEIETIRVGYEPASDDDMLLLLINRDGIKVYNDHNDLFSSIILSLS